MNTFKKVDSKRPDSLAVSWKDANLGELRMGGEYVTASSGTTSTGKKDNEKGWYWNCAAALRTDSWRNKDLT